MAKKDHTITMLVDTYFSISRQARPLIKTVKRYKGITETTYAPDGWEPGFHIEGSLVPRCHFCKAEKHETPALLVVFADEREGFLDRFARKVQRGKLRHEDVLLECSNADCRATVTLLDSLGGDYLDIARMVSAGASS